MYNPYEQLEGKTIAKVRPLTGAEMKELYWEGETEFAFVIWFTDGTYTIPMRDPEGNGPGALLIPEIMVAD